MPKDVNMLNYFRSGIGTVVLTGSVNPADRLGFCFKFLASNKVVVIVHLHSVTKQTL